MSPSLSPECAVERRPETSIRARSLVCNVVTTPDMLKKRFAFGVLWSVVSGGVQQLSALLIAVITARLLGKESYGEFSLIQSTIAAWSVFAGFGLAVTAAKYVAEYRSSCPEKAGAILALSEMFSVVFAAAVSSILFFGASSIALHTFARPEAANELRIAAFILFTASICFAQTGVLSGFESFRLIAKIRVARGLMSLAACAIGVAVAGTEGALWGMVIAWACTAIITGVLVRHTCRVQGIQRSYRLAIDHIQVLFRYSLPSVLAASLVTPATWLASALVVQQNGGYSQVALFNAANQLRTTIFILPALAGDILVPLYSSESRSSLNRSKLLKYAMSFSLATAIPLASIVILSRHFLMSVFGKAFTDADSLVPVIAATGVIIAVINPITTLYAGAGFQWLNVGTNLLWSITLLVCVVILIHYQSGSRALACSTFVAYIGQGAFIGAYTFGQGRRRMLFGESKGNTPAPVVHANTSVIA
jgi:O-antigen/teichoic acid export membrane protein